MGNPKSPSAAGRKANGFVNRRSTVQSRPPAQQKAQARSERNPERADRSASCRRAEAVSAALRVAGDVLVAEWTARGVPERAARRLARLSRKAETLGPVGWQV